MTAFLEPTDPAASRAEVFVRYLDYFRARVIEKVEALPEEELRRSRLVSGWTPIELVKHLTHVERRWLEWGFEGRDVDEPWGDTRDGRWFVAPDESVAEVLGALRSRGGYTTAVLRGHGLDETGQPGERWDGAPPRCARAHRDAPRAGIRPAPRAAGHRCRVGWRQPGRIAVRPPARCGGSPHCVEHRSHVTGTVGDDRVNP